MAAATDQELGEPYGVRGDLQLKPLDKWNFGNYTSAEGLPAKPSQSATDLGGVWLVDRPRMRTRIDREFTSPGFCVDTKVPLSTPRPQPARRLGR